MARGQFTAFVATVQAGRNCVKPEDLSKDPFSDPKEKCTWTTLTSTGSGGRAIGTCLIQDKDKTGKMDINMTYQLPNPETLQGSGTIVMTFYGHTVTSKGNLSGKWLGATCSANDEN
ncbi:MAG: DUF3617 domain-containing protein [Candidatus Acidiferrales bacterium]